MQIIRQSSLLDASGRPIVYSVSAPPYENAGGGPRFRGLAATGGNINATLYGSLPTLRNRSHAAYRNISYVAGGVESGVANEVGTGIRPRWKIKDRTLRGRVQSAWDRWVDESDADDILSFYGQQALCDRTVKLGGEAFVRRRFRKPQDGLSVPMQLQVLEPDFVPVTKNERAANGNVIRAGGEYDALGRLVAWHMHREHPGETQPFRMTGALDFVRVGAADVAHVFWPIRPGQLRGVPWLSSVLLRLNEIDQYEDAEMVRKKTAAMFALFVTSDGALMQGSPLGERDTATSDGRTTIDVQPGSATVLRPGEKIEASEPVDVGQSFEPFMKHMLRAVARGMGITYEQLTGDLKGVSYSSIRAGLLEVRRFCEMIIHAMLVHQLCRRVVQWWVPTAALAGAFSGSVTDDLRAFRALEREMFDVRWIPQGWKWVDPAKEVTAYLDAIRGGLKSRPDAVAELGEDFEVVDDENAAANANADRLKLRYDSDGRQARSSNASAAAPAQPERDPEDEGEEVPTPEEVAA